MTATIINETADNLTLQVVIPFNRSMLEAENALQNALNEAGRLASGNFLERFDTDGSPIVIGQTTLTTKGTVRKEYQTPYGKGNGIKARPKFQRRENVLPTRTGRTNCHDSPHRALLCNCPYKYAEGSGARVALGSEAQPQSSGGESICTNSC